MISNVLHTLATKIPLIGRLSLFWRLFLSLLLMLLFTSALSVNIENYLTNKQLKNRINTHVTKLVTTRLRIIDALKNDDIQALKRIYRNDRHLKKQIIIFDDMGTIIFPKHRLNNHKKFNTFKKNLHKRLKDTEQFHHLLQQTNVSEQEFPTLADTRVTVADGSTYIIKIQPYLPLHEVIALRQDYKAVRLGLIVLFSLLMCYGFSYTLTKRIRRLQQAVHSIREGRYQSDTNMIVSDNDELGKLAHDVAKLSSRLQQSELARKQMLSDISHELRSPLARLNIATEITRDFTPTASKYLDRIEKESNRMNELIGQIIHIQSLQMQGYAMTAENIEASTQVNIAQLLNDIKEDVCFEFHNKSIQWSCHYSDQNLRIFGNQEQLHSAFENIIRNAYIHTKAHTTVAITVQYFSMDTTTHDTGDSIHIEIADMGDGIKDTQDLENIFQPFVRLSQSRERIEHCHQSTDTNHDSTIIHEQKTSGYGLGLAIAHAVIVAHKGHVTAYNRADSHTGLVISVVLPINCIA